MKLAKFAITGALAALMTVGGIGAAFASDARVTTTLNMRDGPGTWYDVIDVLSRGSRVYIEECNRRGTWCFVSSRYADGWVSSRYLRPLHDRHEHYYDDDYGDYEDAYGTEFWIEFNLGY